MNQAEFRDFLINEFAFEFYRYQLAGSGVHLIMRHREGLEVEIGNLVATFYVSEEGAPESDKLGLKNSLRWFYIAQSGEARRFLHDALNL